jgi:hypothetical protein
MAEITPNSTLQDVAAIVSNSLEQAGIAATLSGGAAVSIYTDNEYQSKDLDFVTAALVADISPVLEMNWGSCIPACRACRNSLIR